MFANPCYGVMDRTSWCAVSVVVAVAKPAPFWRVLRSYRLRWNCGLTVLLGSFSISGEQGGIVSFKSIWHLVGGLSRSELDKG